MPLDVREIDRRIERIKVIAKRLRRIIVDMPEVTHRLHHGRLLVVGEVNDHAHRCEQLWLILLDLSDRCRPSCVRDRIEQAGRSIRPLKLAKAKSERALHADIGGLGEAAVARDHGIYQADQHVAHALSPRLVSPLLTDGWTFSDTLLHWHQRQAGRVWAGRRLVTLYDHEEAERRIKDLQREVRQKIRTANSYIDVLVSIAYESCRLTRRAETAERRLVSTTRSIIQIARHLTENADGLEPAGDAAVERARSAAGQLAELAASLSEVVSPVDTRFEPAPYGSDDPGAGVYDWVRYTTPPRNYREPDIRWLLASAVVRFLEDNPGTATDLACTRVGGYLQMLDAKFGAGAA